MWADEWAEARDEFGYGVVAGWMRWIISGGVSDCVAFFLLEDRFHPARVPDLSRKRAGKIELAAGVHPMRRQRRLGGDGPAGWQEA